MTALDCPKLADFRKPRLSLKLPYCYFSWMRTHPISNKGTPRVQRVTDLGNYAFVRIYFPFPLVAADQLAASMDRAYCYGCWLPGRRLLRIAPSKEIASLIACLWHIIVPPQNQVGSQSHFKLAGGRLRYPIQWPTSGCESETVAANLIKYLTGK